MAATPAPTYHRGDAIRGCVQSADRRCGRPASHRRSSALAVGSVAVGTLVIGDPRADATGIPDASAVYLVAVVVVGSVGGTAAALVTAVVAFLVYDLLFTEPRFSLVVADPSELLNLVLVLIVALAVGRLAALGRERAAEADRRAIEATGLFAVSRLLATADATEAVAGAIVDRLARDAGLDRVWIGLDGGRASGSSPTRATGPLPGRRDRHHARPDARRRAGPLGPRPRPLPAEVRPRQARRPTATSSGSRIETGGTRLRLAVGDQAGRHRATRTPRRPGCSRWPPTRSRSASDATGSARRRRAPRSPAGATRSRAPCSTRSRTTCARRWPASARRPGNLADPAVGWSPDGVRRAAETIDAEAQRLDRFVALGPRPQPDRIRRAPARSRGPRSGRARRAGRRAPAPRLGDAPDHDRHGAGPPAHPGRRRPVRRDRLEHPRQRRRPHAAGHRVADPARRAGDTGRIVVTIEDGGPGVADADLATSSTSSSARGRPGEGARRGMGIGLSIVAGMAEAIGGTATARRSELGGLAIDLDLPAAPGSARRRRRPMTTPRRPHPARRGRRRDPPVRGGEPRRARLPGRRGRRRPIRAATLGVDSPGRHPARPRPARRRRARRSSGASGATRRRRSWSCRPATPSPTRSPRSRPAPTTT